MNMDHITNHIVTPTMRWIKREQHDIGAALRDLDAKGLLPKEQR